MASERQRAANRANARKSTGPKSAAGKYRASRNAFRHGLSVPLVADGAWATRVDGLALKIADSMGGAMDIEQARLLAIAQLEVERARSATDAISAQLFSHMEESELAERTNAAVILPTSPGAETFEPDQTLTTLKGLDRYMQQAIAGRNRLAKKLLVL